MIVDIVQERLLQQRITGTPFATPLDAVTSLTAVQSQDYRASLWAIGLRTHMTTEAMIEQALNEKQLVRTLLFRNTVHIIKASDIRWLIDLIGPRMRMIIANIARANNVNFDENIVAKSQEIFIKALQGGKQLTRRELIILLEKAGIQAANLGGLLIVQCAQADGLLCYGPRRDKQQTLMLLHEWLPSTKSLSHEESLAKLTQHYFTGHGPATIEDFVWWSGLTITDCKKGIAIMKSQLNHEVIDGQEYWFASTHPTKNVASPKASLLPNYDEYMVGYKDRSAIFDISHKQKVATPQGNIIFANVVVLDGQVVGTWKRIIKKQLVEIVFTFFIQLTNKQRKAVQVATDHYEKFLGLPIKVKV